MTKVLFHSPITRFYPKVLRSWFEIEKLGIKLDYLFTSYQPYQKERKIENIAWKMIKAREVVLKEGYDFLFNVEDDVVLPKLALRKLLSNNLKVVSGLYRGRPSSFFNTEICGQIKKRKNELGPDTRYPQVGKDFGGGEILELAYICFGCILVKREILEKVEFRKGNDVAFSQDLQVLKEPFYLDTGVKCIHIDKTGEEIKF